MKRLTKKTLRKIFPIVPAPGNWKEQTKAYILRYFTKWKHDKDGKPVEPVKPLSPKALAKSLEKSPAILGSLVPGANRGCVVDAFRCERWLAQRGAHKERAMAILEGAEFPAGILVGAATYAEDGLATSEKDKAGYALKVLALEISAIAELSVDDEEEPSLVQTSEEIKKHIQHIEELSRIPSPGVGFDSAESTREALRVIAVNVAKGEGGRPPAPRSQEAICQLTEINLEAFGRECHEATAVLMRLAFPHAKNGAPRKWSAKDVLEMYKTRRAAINAAAEEKRKQEEARKECDKKQKRRAGAATAFANKLAREQLKINEEIEMERKRAKKRARSMQ